MLLELAEILLAPLGRRIATFGDPGAALKAFTAAVPPPDLLITDFSMEAMSGLDLMEACRKVHPTLKTIVLSGTIAAQLPAASRPPELFLSKPYQPADLTSRVEEVLSGR